MGLKVLITNINLWPPSGTVLYVRDLALELKRLGHSPVVFSSTSGEVAVELRDAGIQVTDRLDRLREKPDVIHGHHYAPTLAALRRWPTVPAIHVCHDHTSPHDRTPLHANIHRHLGVSQACVRRLISEGVPPSRASLALNFVDLARFSPRPPLPERPRRALVFSNYAHAGSHLPAVIEACRQADLELDVAGLGVGRIVTDPERFLPEYEIVFAKAKAAMEAMAVGTAVILCDFSGVGPMVTSTGFDELRPLNFGFDALRDPLQPEILLREIARYDPKDATDVRDLVRSRAGLTPAVEGLIAIYHEAITEQRTGTSRLQGNRLYRWGGRNGLFLWLDWRWNSMRPGRRSKIERLPGAHTVRRRLKRLLAQDL